MSKPASPAYIGRFAPTPSGYLHFGSLVAALASYLDARAVGGRWLLRMEDLDPPREMPGAQDAILRSLETYGFEWDGPLVRQSQRHDAYAEVLQRWLSQGLAYACTCSRKQLEQHQGVYPGFCRDAGHGTENAAIRLRVPELELLTACRASSVSIWAARWATSSFAAAMACMPTNWRWSSTTPGKG